MTDSHEHITAHSDATHGDAPHSDVDYERSDMNLKQVIIVGVFSVVVMGASLFALDDYFSLGREKVMKEASLGVVWPELRAIHTAEFEALTKYKLLNADSGRYQIPIERAMRLLADEAFQKSESSSR